MIWNDGRLFALHTANTSYCLRVTGTGHLEHLYYGRRITLEREADGEALVEKHAFAPANTCPYDAEHWQFTLEDMCLELSAQGKGDLREPAVEVVHADGSRTSDFIFEKAKIGRGKAPFCALPGSWDGEQEADHLTLLLRDKHYALALELHYWVFAGCDVITRASRLVNESGETVELLRLMSAQVDFQAEDLRLTTFSGAWGREMRRTDIPLKVGRHENASCAGASSNRANPFVMLSRPGTGEDAGDCWGFNLIYSGNHCTSAEVSPWGKVRLLTGINPQSFRWLLAPGEDFQAPEAVMSFSPDGFNGLSGHMHRFVREHILRGEWAKKPRPVLLNSWEAAYFNISESKLLSLARAGRDVGVELFVMDDGWFGTRTDDNQSLGDWTEDRKKLPGGLERLSRKVKELGLDFGLWVEPEMVNVNSDLYRAHPDWAIQIPGKPHSEGRSQRILDLTRAEVQDYIIQEMSRVFSSGDISYVKWDMNRCFTDCFSAALPPERQGEVAHRYMLGLYRCLDELTRRFPHILFEGCASGGNRFDLGILCYFPQIWASDNTDALCRAEIQNGYSYGYPLTVMGCHVSACPNHQTLRMAPLETRFQVACFGALGYELDPGELSREEREAVKVQIALYKQWREVFQAGDFYRGRSFAAMDGDALAPGGGAVTEWTCVAPDKKRAVSFLMQRLVVPNTEFGLCQPKGLDPALRYRFRSRDLSLNIKEFGSLVNAVSPIHVKQGSLLHNAVAKLVRLDGETEDCAAWGDALMYAGVKLKPAFSAGGWRDDMRHFPDFASRLYFMEAEG